MAIDAMGVMNDHWGICGFTSALYALHNHSPATSHAALEAGGSSDTRILAEIKTYLRILQGNGGEAEVALLDGIEKFTQSFPGFNNWTITTYIQRINAIVTHGADRANPNFGIGMPPAAVVDYMKRICGFDNARIVDLASTENELILGMGTTKLGMPLYNGLGHYLYSLNNEIYSWGRRYGNPTTAMNNVVPGVNGSDFTIVYKIAL